jgi:hypothetical protein
VCGRTRLAEVWLGICESSIAKSLGQHGTSEKKFEIPYIYVALRRGQLEAGGSGSGWTSVFVNLGWRRGKSSIAKELGRRRTIKKKNMTYLICMSEFPPIILRLGNAGV